MKCIKLINCSKTYGKVNALVNVNYKFERGKFYAIMGDSGSGKSTLINCIAGLIKPSNGLLEYDGYNYNKNSLCFIRNREIGLVYQNFLLNEHMKAIDNVLLPMYLNNNYKSDEISNIACSLLEQFGLKERIFHYPKELSGGEQQRVAIARALANNPNFIIADEPTGNLDKKNEKYIFELLKKLTEEGKGVIVVSHNPEITKYCDVLLKISGGKLNEEKKND